MTRITASLGTGIAAFALTALVGCATGPSLYDKHEGQSYRAAKTAMTEGAKGAEEAPLDPISGEAVMNRYGSRQADTTEKGPSPTVINVGPR